jgi:hypothetical protein
MQEVLLVLVLLTFLLFPFIIAGCVWLIERIDDNDAQ